MITSLCGFVTHVAYAAKGGGAYKMLRSFDGRW